MHGEQGSAKTTTMRMTKGLIDPSLEEMAMVPKDVNDLAQKLSHHWVCYFDNLTIIPDWLSDLLCRVVTGAGFSKRELFSDEGDIIFQLKRVVGINGINIITTRADLLDRSIPLELLPIPEDKRRAEKEFWAEFEQAKPLILGGIFNTLSRAIAAYPDHPPDKVTQDGRFCSLGSCHRSSPGY